MITSRHNPRIAAIRRLHSRKEREATGLFVAEGLRLVGEAARSGAKIETCLVAPELLVSEFGRDTVVELEKRGVPILEVSAEAFASVSNREGPQGIAVVVHQRWTPLEAVDVGEGSCWVVLDSVQDPGNLGTVVRTGDAAGARGVILLDDAADPFDRTSVRASTGAIFWQALVRTSLQRSEE